ncbi:MAG: hypothetical protein WCG55_02245 [bacterium]
MKKSVILSIFLGLALAVSPTLFGVPSEAHADTQCIITSFNANPTSINTGGSATLNWTTSGCNAFGVHLSGGTFMSYSYMPSNGTVTTGPLTGTTTYTLYADGSNSSTNRTTTVYVNGGAYPYTYQCSDGIDNDGNGLTDYPADPGCTSPYDNDESGAYGTNSNRALVAITTPASNVGATSARLNGAVANATSSYVSFFEYGTDYLILDRATTLQTYGPFANTISDTIVTTPGTLYYYRIVARIGNSVYRGEVHSFNSLTSDTTTYPTGSSASSTSINQSGSNSSSQSSSSSSSSTQVGTANAITLTITNKGDAINIGDVLENTITYTNNTTKTLKKATITVSLPQGFIIKQTTEGNITNPTTLTDSIASIAPGQTGSIFLEATVGANTQINTTLVTNGTLAYTLPNGTSDSVVGYVINHASVQNVFAGFALGSGFFPTTIFGWLITVIIILTLILIARRIAKSKHTHGHGGHGGHGDAHGDGHDAPKH